MTFDVLCRFLLWSLAFNYLVLIIWFGLFAFARQWLRNLHGRWFQMPESTFDVIHYGGMAAYKIGIFLFNLTPLIALYIVSGGS